MTEIETAWVAGLLEGEGAFFFTEKKSTTGDVYYEYRIACNMCDPDVLQKLHRIIPGSRFGGPFKQKGLGYKDVYRWCLSRRFDILRVLVAILPYMASRRSERIMSILKAMEDFPARPLWRHGTRQGYTNGCRCDDCKRVNTVRARGQRRKRGVPEKSVAKHGTRTMYSAYKCRCEACCNADREYGRQRRAMRHSLPFLRQRESVQGT